ncbi:LAME_0D05424g1_1 [Lachancea meyersii CBS 8951]|uniref:LAME_0D05424g1_1 n=1 Tax=Lachancea meyersii CBS 8951 TaxID=1266667 RepID=A0A1G4J8Y4_9SACH|nr:LAME_0D05424g1_1 [Lachancea meyersii CBS 8951]
MSHRKRVYPQQQHSYGQGAGAANSPVMVPNFPSQVETPVTNQQPQFLTPAQQQLQQQLHQQVDYASQAMSGMQLHNVPVMDPNLAQTAGMGVPQQGGGDFNSPNMAGTAAMYGPQAGMGYGQQQQPVSVGRPMNQLYPIDLLTELPPPVSDLELPPPPLMVPSEKFVVPVETANAPPDFVRSTLNAVPKTNSLLKKSKLPFGLVIRPYLNLQDSNCKVPLNTDGLVVRCRRCRSYINPFVSFVDGGRRWRCNFCNLANDVPMAFDASQQGLPVNRYERNEMQHAVVEYLAPKEYAARQPPPSSYAFVLDVSQSAIKNGLLAAAARTLLETLDSIPNHDQRTRITILAVDSSIHYFAIPLDEDGDQIKMMDVVDLDEPFLPMPNSMYVSLQDCRSNIEKLLNQLPEIFQYNIMSKMALGPALKAAFNLIKGVGGKIIVVASTMPNLGIGKLQKRNEAGVANTPKEASQLLNCQDAFYKNFTIDCNKSQVTIDMFLATEEYIDVASLSNLARFTAGQTHFYPGWSASKLTDVMKFTKEFSKHLTMDLSMEAVMRARGSSGLRMTRFYGHFFNRSSDLCAFPTFPRDQSYVFEISIDEQLVRDFAYLQIAVLLSLNTGQRRIRVITLAIPTTDSLAETYASADQLAMTAFFSQKAVEKAYSNLEDAREYLNRSVQEILATYKKEIVVSNTAGGAPLRLSANLRMFPLLMHSLTKHMAFRAGLVPSDHRAASLNFLESSPLPYLIKNIYAKVYSLHDMPDDAGLPNELGETVLPDRINATSSLLERYGLYLIDNSTELFLWVGGDAVNELTMDVFGTPDILEIPIGKQELPLLENSEFNSRVRNIISKLREHDDVITYQPLYIVRGASLSEPVNHPSAREVATLRLWATSTLVEDKILNSQSYREFLQNMKTRISK